VEIKTMADPVKEKPRMGNDEILRKFLELDNANKDQLRLPAREGTRLNASALSSQDIWRILNPPSIRYNSAQPRVLKMIDTRVCHSPKQESHNLDFNLMGYSRAPKKPIPAAKHPEAVIDFTKADFARLSPDLQRVAETSGATKVRLQKYEDEIRVQYLSAEGKVLSQREFSSRLIKQNVLPTEKEAIQIACKDYKDALRRARNSVGGALSFDKTNFATLGAEIQSGLQKVGATSLKTSKFYSTERLTAKLPRETSFSDPSLPIESIVLSPDVSCSITASKNKVTISNIKGVKIDLGILATPWVYPTKVTIDSNGTANFEFTVLGFGSSKTIETGGGIFSTFVSSMDSIESVRDGIRDVSEKKVAMEMLKANPAMAQALLRQEDPYAQMLLAPEKYAARKSEPKSDASTPKLQGMSSLLGVIKLAIGEPRSRGEQKK
jgi:hypothetical protein